MIPLPVSSVFAVCCVLLIIHTEDVESYLWIIRKLQEHGFFKKPTTSVVNQENNNACKWCVLPPCLPTVVDFEDFSAADDVKEINRALGFILNVKKDVIISILTSRSELQRQAIEREYRIQFGIDLSDALEKCTFPHSRFQKLIKALATPLQKYFAKVLHKAIERKDRITMIELFTTLPGCVIREINKYYSEMYGKDTLNRDITMALREYYPQGQYIDVLLVMFKGERDHSPTVDKDKATFDARRMAEAIHKDVWETKLSMFQDVFTKRSIPQLKETIVQYETLRKHDRDFESLETDIERKMESVKEIYIYMIKIVRDQHKYFAIELEKLLNVDVKDPEDIDRIIFIIRGRCDIDLGNIKVAYQKKYSISLYKRYTPRNIHFRKTLLALIQR